MSDERCGNCGHRKGDHGGYCGLCDGLGFNDARQMCGCAAFVPAASSTGASAKSRALWPCDCGHVMGDHAHGCKQCGCQMFAISAQPTSSTGASEPHIVHNHGPEEGPSLACKEFRGADGLLRGECVAEPSSEPPPPSETATTGLVAEMAKQASLGHKQFCVGVHEHEGGEREWEWIDWPDAFARLVSALSLDLVSAQERRIRELEGYCAQCWGALSELEAENE